MVESEAAPAGLESGACHRLLPTLSDAILATTRKRIRELPPSRSKLA